MSQQFINIGYVVNDGTGDTLRDAFEKVNGNFNELFTSTLSGTSAATPNTVVRRDSAAGAAFLKIEFKNEYAAPANFPAAASHTGMVAYANSTGKEYYSNGSQWIAISSASSTDTLAEGSANLYFTNIRARNAVDASGPSWVSYDKTTGIFTFSDLTVNDIGNSASTTYVDTAIDNLKDIILDGVGANLDTLKELATAINADPVFYQTIANGLSTKANIASPTFTGVASAPTAVPGTNTTQLATTAFVAAAVAGKDNSDEIAEGSTNLYFTTARARNALSAGSGISYNSTTGAISSTITQYTDTLAKATLSAGSGISYNSTTGAISSTITQYTDTLARSALSVSGNLSYNSSTGVISYTTPTTFPFSGLTGNPTTISGYGISDAYTQTEVDTALDLKADAVDVYTKAETYSQTEVDSLIASGLAGQPETYTKAELWNLLLNISNRLNEAGIPDILGTFTAPIMVIDDWGSITDTLEMPEDYGDLTDIIAY